VVVVGVAGAIVVVVGVADAVVAARRVYAVEAGVVVVVGVAVVGVADAVVAAVAWRWGKELLPWRVSVWPVVMVVVVAVMVEVVVVVVVVFVVWCAGAGEWRCGGRVGRQQRGVLASVGASLACACGFVARGVGGPSARRVKDATWTCAHEGGISSCEKILSPVV